MRWQGVKIVWNQLQRTPLRLLAGLLISFWATDAYGTSWRTPTAVESNILIANGKMFFVQGTGGLTILDLNTGRVLLRRMVKEDYGYVTSILSSPVGIILHSSRTATAVDSTTIEPLWFIDSCSHPLAVGSHLLCHDGYHNVRCHDATTGQEKWSAELRGGWDLALSSKVAAVATVPFYDGTPTVWALDVESGEQLFQKHAPQGKQWCNVYCDNEFVYVLTTTLHSSDFSEKPDGVVKYDLKGNELEHLDLSSPKITRLHKSWDCPFLFDGKVFPNQENIRAAYTHELKADPNSPLLADFDDSLLGTGILKVLDQKDSTGKIGRLLQFTGMENSWKAYLPYSKKNEWFSTAQESDGRIILATSGGHVECLDSKTGKPNWLYIFPSFRRILSHSDTYIGTYWRSRETTRANIFYEGLKAMGEEGGSITVPNDFNPEDVTWSDFVEKTQYNAPIITDPSADLRFETLPSRVLHSRLVVIASILGLAFILVAFRKNLTRIMSPNEDSTHIRKYRRLQFAVACFGVLLVAALGILFYGRISTACTATYWVVAIIAMVLTHKTTTTLFQKKWVLSYLLLFMWGGVLGILMSSNMVP